METSYQPKGFDVRVVRYEEIHKVKGQDYQELIKAINPQPGGVIFEGCCGYADVSKHILEETKDFDKKPELYIQDESVVQINRAMREVSLPIDHMLRGDIRATGMPENKFNTAVIKMGVHELPKDQQIKVFEEMHRILKPEGKFIIWELSLDKDTQEIFQDIVRKKDELAGFDKLVENRYFQRRDELENLFKEAGFKDIKEEYKIEYTFNPQGRFEEMISKDRLALLDEKGSLSEEDEKELIQRAQERVNALIEYIKERIPEDIRKKINYKDLGNDIEITVNKVIMSGKK